MTDGPSAPASTRRRSATRAPPGPPRLRPPQLLLARRPRRPPAPGLARPLAGFAARDHLGDADASLRENLDTFLADPRGRPATAAGSPCWPTPACSATCSTRSRSSGATVPDGRLECVVVEVHNTYGDRHAYLVRPDGPGRAATSKELYVSPFNDVSGSLRPARPRAGPPRPRDGHLDPPGTPALRRHPGRRRQARHARRRPAHRRDAAPRTPRRHGPDQVARHPPLGAPAADPAPTHPLTDQEAVQ